MRVADCAYNGERIAALVAEAAGRGVEVVLFPELSVTGYTCGDLFLQPALLAAAEQTLAELLRRTAELNTAFVVGLPVAVDDMLYNCAVVAAAGEVLRGARWRYARICGFRPLHRRRRLRLVPR